MKISYPDIGMGHASAQQRQSLKVLRPRVICSLAEDQLIKTKKVYRISIHSHIG